MSKRLVMLLLALILLGAFLYRVRGGFLPTGSTQLARAIWCVPTGALIGVLTGNWIAAAAGAILAFAGLMLPNDPWQRMETPLHWAQGAAVSALRVLLVLAPLVWATGHSAALLWAVAGAAAAPLYWLGWQLPPRAFGKVIDWHTAWGEAFFGGLAWALILVAA